MARRSNRLIGPDYSHRAAGEKAAVNFPAPAPQQAEFRTTPV
jgi:hypothetical protein